MDYNLALSGGIPVYIFYAAVYYAVLRVVYVVCAVRERRRRVFDRGGRLYRQNRRRAKRP